MSMNKEERYRDQAEEFRKNIERSTFVEGEPIAREELPPRSAIHGRSKKWKFKMKYPLIRFLALFFVLLPITIISIYILVAKDKIENVKDTITEPSSEFETIEIESRENQITDAEEEEKLDAHVNEAPENSLSDPLSMPKNTHEAEKTAPMPLTVVDKDIVYHKVKKGETMYRIAMKYYQSKAGMERIKAANNLSSNEITAGQVLLIPLNK